VERYKPLQSEEESSSNVHVSYGVFMQN